MEPAQGMGCSVAVFCVRIPSKRGRGTDPQDRVMRRAHVGTTPHRGGGGATADEGGAYATRKCHTVFGQPTSRSHAIPVSRDGCLCTANTWGRLGPSPHGSHAHGHADYQYALERP